MLSRVTHMTMLSVVTCVMNLWHYSGQTFGTSYCPFGDTDLASLLTDHAMLGLPIRAKYKHFKSICEHTFDNYPIDSSSSFLNWCMDLNICRAVPPFYLPIRSISQRIFEHVLPYRRTTQTSFAWSFSHPGNFFSCSSKKTWFKHLFLLLNNDFVRFAFTLSTSQIYVVKKWCWFVKINIVSSISSTWEPCSASFQPFWCHSLVPIRFILVFGEQKDIHTLVLFPIQSPIELPRIVSPTTSLLMGVHIKFVHKIFNVCPGLWPLKSWKTYPNTSGHSDSGILSNVGASSTFSWV